MTQQGKDTILATTLTWVVALVLFGAVAACGKKAEKPNVVATEPAASAPVKDLPNSQQMLSAMLRGHPNSRQVCIDGLRDRAFFLDYGPLLRPGAQPDDQYHGWFFIEAVDFYKTSNDTWFITPQKDEKYVQAYPDVTGLPCKAQQ